MVIKYTVLYRRNKFHLEIFERITSRVGWFILPMAPRYLHSEGIECIQRALRKVRIINR